MLKEISKQVNKCSSQFFFTYGIFKGFDNIYNGAKPRLKKQNEDNKKEESNLINLFLSLVCNLVLGSCLSEVKID